MQSFGSWAELDTETVLTVIEAEQRQQAAWQAMCSRVWCNPAHRRFSVTTCAEQCLVTSPEIIPDPGLGTYVGGYGGWWYGPPGQSLWDRPAASGASASLLAQASCVV